MHQFLEKMIVLEEYLKLHPLKKGISKPTSKVKLRRSFDEKDCLPEVSYLALLNFVFFCKFDQCFERIFVQYTKFARLSNLVFCINGILCIQTPSIRVKFAASVEGTPH